MIGDPVIVNDKDYIKARRIIYQLNDKKIILIGGGSGTHKTETAYCLQRLLYDNKKSSFVISLDDYYLVHATIRSDNRKKQGLDSVGLSEIDWEGLKRIYEDFNSNTDIQFKRTHLFLDAIEYNTIQADQIEYLIFEGLYTNYLRKIYSDNLSVFLEGSPEETLEFRQTRQKENEDDPFRQKVVQKEFNVVCQLKRYADLTLPFKDNKNE